MCSKNIYYLVQVLKCFQICDLLNLIGLPALDPALKRAQFNQVSLSIFE